MITLEGLLSLIVLPIGALIFLGLAFYQRGAWWWSMLSGLLFILFGIHCVTATPIFAFMRELSAAWIIIGIAIFWMPAWYRKKKDDKTLMEMAAEADGEEIDDEDKLDTEISRQRREKWRAMRRFRKEE